MTKLYLYVHRAITHAAVPDHKLLKISERIDDACTLMHEWDDLKIIDSDLVVHRALYDRGLGLSDVERAAVRSFLPAERDWDDWFSIPVGGLDGAMSSLFGMVEEIERNRVQTFRIRK